jgi:L-amino acid N-acyltransferase YncA
MITFVRDASIEDLPRIVEIYNSAIPSRRATADVRPVAVEERMDWFSRFRPEKRPLCVLECGGTIAGWAGLSSFYGRPAYEKTAEISFYVATEHRRRGVGRCLVEALIERCPALNVTTLVAMVFAHNRPSICLLKSLEFVWWGRLPGVAELGSVRRDLLILGRSLTV